MAEQNAVASVRQCSACGATKELREFSKQANCTGGHRNECQLCRNAKAREWYYKNKERRTKTVEAWRLANKDKIAEATAAWAKANSIKRSNYYHARKARLRENGVYYIKPKELERLYSSVCFYCKSKDNITQDHVIPIHRGGRHSIGNLIASCQKCNSSKQDKTITEWKLQLQKIADGSRAAI